MRKSCLLHILKGFYVVIEFLMRILGLRLGRLCLVRISFWVKFHEQSFEANFRQNNILLERQICE